MRQFQILLLTSICVLFTESGIAQHCLFRPATQIINNYSTSPNYYKSGTIKIPVVVHVLYNNTEQNISDEQILSQLKVLNEDFQRQNADTSETLNIFKSVAADCGLQFLFATKDNEGNITHGITRTSTIHGIFGGNDIHYSAKGGRDAWNTKKYLNIWVCDLPDGTSGISSTPGSDSLEDGIVIDYKYFGTTGTLNSSHQKGRTATHETGHWLGLRHLWGNSGNCTDDDGIDDTPKQSGPSSGCELAKQSCGTLNMIQNFMDYTDDICMNIFTSGQKNVMRTVLLNERKSIVENASTVTNIDEYKTDNRIIFYPNPLKSGTIKIETDLRVSYLIITDQIGETIMNNKMESPVIIDASGFQPGIYFLQITVDDNRKITKKMIIY